MITLHNGDKEIDIEVKDESYSYEAIMEECSLTLSWENIHSLCIFRIRDILKFRLAPGVTSTGSVIL